MSDQVKSLRQELLLMLICCLLGFQQFSHQVAMDPAVDDLDRNIAIAHWLAWANDLEENRTHRASDGPATPVFRYMGNNPYNGPIVYHGMYDVETAGGGSQDTTEISSGVVQLQLLDSVAPDFLSSEVFSVRVYRMGGARPWRVTGAMGQPAEAEHFLDRAQTLAARFGASGSTASQVHKSAMNAIERSQFQLPLIDVPVTQSWATYLLFLLAIATLVAAGRTARLMSRDSSGQATAGFVLADEYPIGDRLWRRAQYLVEQAVAAVLYLLLPLLPAALASRFCWHFYDVNADLAIFGKQESAPIASMLAWGAIALVLAVFALTVAQSLASIRIHSWPSRADG